MTTSSLLTGRAGSPDATLPADADRAVRVRGLTKSYPDRAGGTRAAVDAVDLDVARGEILGLLGPNGAGKSTLTEVLEGYRRRDAGDVEVLGRDPWRAPGSWRARTGIVLQESSEAPDLTVTEVVRHFTTLYPTPRPADEVIDLVGLSGKRRARVASLSGGQRRRLDVGLGIVGRPELLFLDEPTTGFDPAARRQFWDLIERLRTEGTTILLTTHYLDEAERLADRLAVITQGRVVACAAPEALGRELRTEAVVRWTDPDGTARSRATVHPTALVTSLAARAPDGEVADLEVRRMSLEDVYLSLVREADAAAGDAPGESTADGATAGGSAADGSTAGTDGTTDGEATRR